MTLDYAIGLCDRCNRPVVRPELIVEGAGRCLCETPELVTWEQMDADWKRDRAERERRYRESPYQPRDNFSLWKKRAKRL